MAALETQRSLFYACGVPWLRNPLLIAVGVAV